MHRLFIGLVVVLSALTGACGGDDAPASADMLYRVGCPSMCVPQNRDLMVQNGQNGFSVSCMVTTATGGRALSFTATSGEYGIRVQNAFFTGEGGLATGGGCRVIVEEGANDFEGSCTSESTPDCRLNVMISGSEVHGDIFCSNLVNAAVPSQIRTLTDSLDTSAPADFVITGCTGL